MKIEALRERTTRLLTELVQCPSISPEEGASPEPPFGELRLQERVAARLAALGAALNWSDALPGRKNLVATFTGRDPARSLMVEAHADTVGVEGMSVKPFDAVIEGGRLYGRGAADTKGAMAAMLTAVEDVLRDGPLPLTLHVVLTCNEERGAHGAHALMKTGFRADAAIVGEPTGLQIVHTHKGAIRWKLQTSGVAAHSSAPELGVNAISLMARVIAELEGALIPALARRSHPLLGRPTMSVGTIRGGMQVNVIPDRCEIEMDRRLIAGETDEEATGEVVAVLERLARADDRLKWSLRRTQFYPPLEGAVDSPVASALAEGCRRVLGRAEFAAAPWGTDGGIFSHYGIPSVIFGPGSIRQAHTRDEHIELDQVAQAALIYSEAIRAFAADVAQPPPAVR